MRLVIIALGWTAGILLAANNRSALPHTPAVWAGLSALAVAACWLVWPDRGRRWLMLGLLGFTLGGLRMALAPLTSDLAQYHDLGGLTIEGIVAGEPQVQGDRVRLRVAAETVTRAGTTTPSSGLALVETGLEAAVRYGDRVRATGLLVTPGASDTFSYADYLARSGVFSLMPNAVVTVQSLDHGLPLMAALFDLKDHLRSAIARALPEPYAGLLTGILLGDESGLAPEVRQAFNATGSAHIIAISGFNMAILSGVVMGALERLRASRWLALSIGIAALAGYTLLTGASPPVLRAALMSSMLIVGAALRRQTYVPASLAFVTLLLTLENPTVVWDVGFQLSLFATLGLALFAKPFTRALNRGLAGALPARWAPAVGSFLAEPVAVSLAAQVVTLPLVALYFDRLSLVALGVNLLVVPIQAHLLIIGLAAAFTALIMPVLAQLLFWFNLLLLGWTIGVVRLFARLPFADVEFQADPRWVALFFVVLMGGALMEATRPRWARRLARWISGRAVASAAALAGLGLTLLMGAVIASRPDGRLHMWLLDVGHSNAVLIQTPAGVHILIDGGRFPSRLLTALGDRLPFNKQHIEILALTQPDENDFNALLGVAARYHFGLVLTNGQPNLGNAYTALQDRLAPFHQVAVHAGYHLEIDDGVRLEVLHPVSPPALSDRLDDHALVLRLSYGQARFLLAGDLSARGQQQILEQGGWPAANVLQLPRHGGIRSLDPDFLTAVSPQVIVVQSDRANRLGDPDPDTLALVTDRPLFRTDQGGTIHLWTDGRDLWIEQG